ncbi:peptidoglycan DD-metalloendopeptidase family protein [Flavobacterium qiangtangense]|uniref:Peptidoglycan DD-metalloendopeptidase family protein n=1 Tax=Flavobacterium qiangtangense TaxID=1442595 RepID=A0ABW1PRT8_9FLAO
MKRRIIVYPLVFGFMALLLLGCANITKVTDSITNPDARKIYEREFKTQPAVFEAWTAVFEQSKLDSLSVSLPYGEKGKFIPTKNVAYSYTLQLIEGEVLTANVERDSIKQQVFIDVFEWNEGSKTFVEAIKTDTSKIEYVPKNSGVYKIIIQPEIGADSDFFIALNKKPVYGFPVSGKGNAAIQSFWGNVRDGGKRSHEGIDIFAKKGTPVVAVYDGTISRTGNMGLGGKQVWQRTGLFGNSIYYAHLDSIAIESGAKVKAGDTLGFVGNTGNARFTPPHLHFGIYKGYQGAVDPLPFVYETAQITSKSYPKNFKNNYLKVKGSKANLRKNPETNGAKVGELLADEKIILLGQTKDWLHIRTALNQKAFLHKSLAIEIK